MRLKDKIAIVTGAAQGIGREYSLRFADEGAAVAVVDTAAVAAGTAAVSARAAATTRVTVRAAAAMMTTATAAGVVAGSSSVGEPLHRGEACFARWARA